MRIPSGKTDQVIIFVAVDATDLKTRETGLTSFTVYRSRNGGAATAYTTPTVAELSAANMPGVYSLLIDEDTTIASTSDSEEYCVHITQAAMAPVTRTIELYRYPVTTGVSLVLQSNGRLGANAVDATALAAGSITSGKFAAGAIDAAAIANAAIDAATFAAGAIDAAAIATGAIDADALAADAGTEIGTAVWASATRTLTANTNLNDLSAAGVRAAVGLAAANLDTQIDALPTAVENATELLDQANGVETGLTFRQWLRAVGATTAGKMSGAGTGTEVFRNAVADTANRVTATVDASGNRSAITYNL